MASLTLSLGEARRGGEERRLQLRAAEERVRRAEEGGEARVREVSALCGLICEVMEGVEEGVVGWGGDEALLAALLRRERGRRALRVWRRRIPLKQSAGLPFRLG